MRKFPAVVGLLAALLAASCGKVPRTSYYTLRVPPPPQAGDPKTNFSLGVEHFRAADVLRDDRIVYYQSPTALDFYQYHRWSSDPASMLTERTARWLGEMGVFAAVRVLPSREPADYTLRGRLLNFEEVDYEGEGKGRVALALELVRARDRRVVWTATRQAEHAVAEGGVEGVVNALNASTEDVLHGLLPGLAEQVERDFSESQKK